MFHTRNLLAVAAAIPIGACSALATKVKRVRDVELCLIDYRWRYLRAQG